MANLNKQTFRLKLKQGLKSNLDDSATTNESTEGEPAYTTDDKQFFIFDGARYLPPNFEMLVSYENEGVFNDNEAVIYY